LCRNLGRTPGGRNARDHADLTPPLCHPVFPIPVRLYVTSDRSGLSVWGAGYAVGIGLVGAGESPG
jgi:hypothetical protein